MSTEQEIYDEAVEQTQNIPETPTEASPEAKDGRARDDKGRFAPASPEPSSEVVQEATPQPEAEPETEHGGRVPSWRVKEEADRARRAEESLQELKAELQQMRMAMYQQRQPEPQPAPEPPDIFADPQGFIQSLDQKYENRLKTLQLENSLRFAHYAHGDKFNEAYQSFTDYVNRTRDQATYQRVMASNDPGEALVGWFKDTQLQKELGGSDLKTFLEKQKEEWMKDPQFQAKVIETFKATQSPTGNTVTNLPPSLSRVTAAGSAHDVGGNSGNDIYSYATAKR